MIEIQNLYFWRQTLENVRARPIHVRARPIHVRARPIHVRARPIHVRARPIHVRARPIDLRARPIHVRARPTNLCALSHLLVAFLPEIPFFRRTGSPFLAQFPTTAAICLC